MYAATQLSVLLVVFTLAFACGGDQKTGKSSGDTIVLGDKATVAFNKSYKLKDTKLRVKVLGTSMANARNAKGQQVHYLMMDLEVSFEGKTEKLDISEGSPKVWHGFKFSPDSLGFSYRDGGGSLIIERAK